MKRDVILDTAARLFAERGFNNTPTSLLAKEAGVAEGTIFRHFQTKDDIFFTLINNVKTQLISDIEKYLEVRGPENALEKLESVIKSFYVFVKKNNMEFSLIFRDAPTRYGQRHDDVFLQIKEIYSYVTNYLKESIEEGKQEGIIREDVSAQDYADMLMSTMVGLVRAVHFGFIDSSDDILKSVIESYTRLLTTK
ncbi:TetR/AcrR family transcriptional regulator [Desulfovibrio subterraneus]|jgi:AcrR family transcriptional regulator|uniref:TetR family transcriptional regulator n=1 Tax=Desulfovibrio subterraneus TaxID=2718620 RepID=A0A7J0BH31_9BACT|nr:TetR/AcrR family transcriptional regulator [Desulfovibrio subterraneus]WBF67270.1 TetR/AcrR family transcriptional regulator [Desulfovibrio subterraneus]GFM33020.1 TetR family transcriptional regulator [Desulfovibrio subterraneus]